jgi:hypothetical protein
MQVSLLHVRVEEPAMCGMQLLCCKCVWEQVLTRRLFDQPWSPPARRFNAPSLSDNVSRRWRDGSLELDLPTFLLSEMFNCNHFIVSQTNPHIAPLLNLKKSLSRRWANLLELELRHRWADGCFYLCY